MARKYKIDTKIMKTVDKTIDIALEVKSAVSEEQFWNDIEYIGKTFSGLANEYRLDQELLAQEEETRVAEAIAQQQDE